MTQTSSDVYKVMTSLEIFMQNDKNAALEILDGNIELSLLELFRWKYRKGEAGNIYMEILT